DSFGPSRRRSIHDSGVGRVSGSVRRGKLYGQGDLRRQRIRGSDARSLSREHVAEPRSHRRYVHACGSRHRHRALRRLSDTLSRLHAPQAPLDSRRLADPELAGRDGTGSGRSGAESTVDALALEDLRQPETVARRDSVAGVVARWLVYPAWFADAMDARRAGVHRISVAVRGSPRDT